MITSMIVYGKPRQRLGTPVGLIFIILNHSECHAPSLLLAEHGSGQQLD